MSTQSKDSPLVYGVAEAAQLLGLTRNGAYEAVKRGEIPSIRIGRLVKIPRQALHRMLEAAEAKLKA